MNELAVVPHAQGIATRREIFLNEDNKKNKTKIYEIWKSTLLELERNIPKKIERKIEKKHVSIEELKITHRYLRSIIYTTWKKQKEYKYLSKSIFNNHLVVDKKKLGKLIKKVERKINETSKCVLKIGHYQDLNRILDVKENQKKIKDLLLTTCITEQKNNVEESVKEIFAESLKNIINFYLDNDHDFIPIAQKDLKAVYADLYAIFPYNYCITPEEIEQVLKLEIDYRDLQLVNLVHKDAYLFFPEVNFRIPSDFKDPLLEAYHRINVDLGIKSESADYFHHFNINQLLEKEYDQLILQLENASYVPLKEPNLFLSEYKIHLHPKRKYMFECVCILQSLIYNEAELCKNLSGFKILLDPFPSFRVDDPPRIVLYPKFGKNPAQIVLNKLFDAFKDHLYMASHKTPRFNLPSVNGLLFYTQGDSYRKFMLMENFPHLFDKMFVHHGALFHPDLGAPPPLDLPENF